MKCIYQAFHYYQRRFRPYQRVDLPTKIKRCLGKLAYISRHIAKGRFLQFLQALQNDARRIAEGQFSQVFQAPQKDARRIAKGRFHYNNRVNPWRIVGAFPSDLSLGIRFPSDMSLGNHRWGNLVRDTIPAIIPSEEVGPTHFSVKEVVPRWHKFPRRQVAEESSG
ncbi:hypothetical protein Tco_0697629 [Tanacetum coccineum]